MAGGAERLALYKARGLGGRTIKDRRKEAAAQRKEAREQRRTEAFTANRGLQSTEIVPITREQKLIEWRRKKEVAKKSTGKPPFVFAKITYNDQHLYKPPESTTFRPPSGVKPVVREDTGRTLRAHTRLQRREPTQTVKDAIKDFATSLASVSRKGAKLKGKKSAQKQKANDDAEILNRTFDGPSTSAGYDTIITEIPVGNEHSELNKGFQQIYPYAQEEGSHLHTIEEQNLDTQKCVKYFRSLHSDAVSKLTDMSHKWTELQLQGLPQTVHDEVDVAVGYAKLLVSSKLQQFEGLIAQHESAVSLTELKVLSTDLDGFWSLVFLEVEDVYRKFERLKEMERNNWREITVKPLPVKRAKEPKAKVLKLKGNATSNLRSFIANARQRGRMDETENMNPLGSLNIDGVIMPKPMSPVVLRVSSMGKQFGSPKVATNELRSPLHYVNRQENGKMLTPASAKKATRRTNITPGLTPLRRSTRIVNKKSPEV